MDHQFTLVFSLYAGPLPCHDDLVERLGAAGCTDALVGLGSLGHLILAFARAAESLEDAVESAMVDVTRAIPHLTLVDAYASALPDTVSRHLPRAGRREDVRHAVRRRCSQAEPDSAAPRRVVVDAGRDRRRGDDHVGAVAIAVCGQRPAPLLRGDARIGIFVSLNPATGDGVLGDSETETEYRFKVLDINARERFVGLARGTVVDYVLDAGATVLAVNFVKRHER